MDLFLKKALSGIKYEKFPLTKEGSDRQYIRVQTSHCSWVLACSSLEQQKKFLLRLEEFNKVNLNVPQLKSKNDKKGFLLLEDLGDESLEKKILQESISPLSVYKKALDQIIQLQAGQYHTLSRFSVDQFLKEILWTEKYLINDFLKVKLKKNIRSACLIEWYYLCEQLSGVPYKPAHRDYHSRNIFIKNKKLYMIDFQDAGFFPRFYDAASLLYDVYVASKIKRKDREKLLDYFLLKSVFSQKGVTKKIKEEWSITVIQRLFKACGSFASFHCIKKQDTHLKYIKPALKSLKTQLQDIEKYPAFLSLVLSLLDEL